MATRYTSGAATIAVDDAAVVRLLDRVSDGAASQFIDTTSKVLDEVKTGAVARWPVATGASRAGFRVEADVGTGAVRTRLLNTAEKNGRGYGWFVRYSVRTTESLKAEIDGFGAMARRAEAAVNAQDDDARRSQFIAVLVAMHRRSNFGSLPLIKGAENAEAITRRYAAQLRKRHGSGAPDESLAGVNVWARFVRKPARKATKQIVGTLQDQIARLARGA